MPSAPKLTASVRLSDGGAPVHVSPGTGSFAFSGDAHSRKLGLHDLRSGESLIHHSIGADLPTAVSTSHDTSKCAFGTASGALFVWDVQFPTLLESFHGPEIAGASPLEAPPDGASKVNTLAWHPRGHVLACGSASGALTIWDMVLGAPIFSIPAAHPGGVSGLAWTAHGRALTSVGADGNMKVWNSRHGEVEAVIDGSGGADDMWHDGPVTCVHTIGDMSRVAISGGEDGRTFLSVLKAGEKNACGVFSAPRPHEAAAVACVRIAPLESVKPMRCASGGSDGTLQLFDMDRKMPMGAFMHDGGAVRQVEFNHDGNVLFSAAGHTVTAWDTRVVAQESPEIVFGEEERGKVSSFCLGNSGASLIVGNDDGVVRMYDMRYPAGNVPDMPVLPTPVEVVNK